MLNVSCPAQKEAVGSKVKLLLPVPDPSALGSQILKAISEKGMAFFISRKRSGFNLNITKRTKFVYEGGP
jgi:hypothetical protein